MGEGGRKKKKLGSFEGKWEDTFASWLTHISPHKTWEEEKMRTYAHVLYGAWYDGPEINMQQG